ncbi:hypothetical protein HNQ82_002871 [Anoxybacillus tengchongensis]|uniref:Uncharacterized protein n=1 Tax=Anoxybacillus tengchongensis TaxID=576944 RepID=A0A7X0DBK9_9BACL|nr:hypothetical protein [Anoxybacillus tengchongensis]MBB6177996.1 hypothetical protein [Anoxybacillus tengchongensis]
MDLSDSAAMTKDTLAQTKTANAFLITRGPSSLRIVKTALVEADAQDTPWSAPLELPDGRIQRALGQPPTYEQRRILQGLGMDESIYV